MKQSKYINIPVFSDPPEVFPDNMPESTKQRILKKFSKQQYKRVEVTGTNVRLDRSKFTDKKK